MSYDVLYGCESVVLLLDGNAYRQKLTVSENLLMVNQQRAWRAL